MANTKYLDYTGLGIFLKQLKDYIGSEIAKIHGGNLYLYNSGENNPTITSQIEDIWELIGVADSTGGSLAEKIESILGEYVKSISVPENQDTLVKIKLLDDNDGRVELSLEDNGLNGKLDATVSSIATSNGGGAVTLSTDNSTGAVTITVNSKTLTDLVNKLQSDLSTETANRTNGDLALGTRIDNLNERLESIKTSYVKNISSKNSSTKNTKYINITTNDKKSGEVTININDSVLSETMDSVMDNQSNMANQIMALAAGLSLNVSAVSTETSSSTIYKNTSTSITITAATKNTTGNVTASEIKIMDGNTALKTSTNVDTTNVAKNITTTSNTYTFKAIATVNGMTLSKNASVNARYPVYYGMGTAAADVKSKGKKASARTTAISNTTYDATATSNGVRFYLLVPNDVTRPSSFTMGGAPVNMAYGDVTLDGVTYRAYYTVATYNNGGEVKIKAQ